MAEEPQRLLRYKRYPAKIISRIQQSRPGHPNLETVSSHRRSRTTVALPFRMQWRLFRPQDFPATAVEGLEVPELAQFRAEKHPDHALNLIDIYIGAEIDLKQQSPEIAYEYLVLVR